MASHLLPLQELLRQIATLLSEAGIENPSVDAELIAAHVLGESRGRIQALVIMGYEPAHADAARILDLAEQRSSRVPLQHLTGRAPFRQIELRVGPGVFVPRPETELIAQIALDEIASTPHPVAVDLCTGSGAIALALANESPNAQVWAVEKSPEAHAWAALNVEAWGDGRVNLLLGDVAELESLPVLSEDVAQGKVEAEQTHGLAAEFLRIAGKVNVLASNPPYIPVAAVPIDPEVRDHDPELALYGGEDGLDLIRILSRVGLKIVAPGGLIVLEHTEEQGAAIRRRLERDGWLNARTHPDLTGRDRATTARAQGIPE